MTKLEYTSGSGYFGYLLKIKVSKNSSISYLYFERVKVHKTVYMYFLNIFCIVSTIYML